MKYSELSPIKIFKKRDSIFYVNPESDLSVFRRQCFVFGRASGTSNKTSKIILASVYIIVVQELGVLDAARI